MPRPKLRNLIQLKAETQESYPIYKQEGYERISHVETKHSLRLAIKRVLELNSSSKTNILYQNQNYFKGE